MSVINTSQYTSVDITAVTRQELHSVLKSNWEHIHVSQKYNSRLPAKERTLIMEAEIALRGVSALANLPLMQDRYWEQSACLLQGLEGMGWHFFYGIADGVLFIVMMKGGAVSGHDGTVLINNDEDTERTDSFDHLFIQAIGSVLRGAAAGSAPQRQARDFMSA